MLWAALCVICASNLLGQALTGGIEGRVLDASGAAVPGAVIVATHLGTGAELRGETGEIGQFQLLAARLGRYDVSVSANGFRPTVVSGAVVEVGSSTILIVALEVGEASFAVTVSAEAAQSLLNTVNAEIGGVVDQRQILDLPLNGRNAVELALQQAGVSFERSPTGEGAKFFVNGQRHRSANFTLDGIDTQDNLNRASSTMIDQPLLAMSAENVQEFRVVTGLASAEYSRGGVQISAVTRAGGNQMHGSLFEFHRNTQLNANDFFNNSAGVERAPLVRNQFGGRIGGPLVRNRTFYFFGYQQTRQAEGIPVNRSVYTAEARQGVFRFLDGTRNSPGAAAAAPEAVRSVNLLECSGRIQGALGRDCLDGRFDGANRATPDPFITGTVFEAVPLPNNFDIGDGLNTGGYRFNASSKTVEHLPSARLDHRLTQRHSFFATFNYTDREIQGDYINGREPIYPTLAALGARTTLSKSFTGTLSSTFSPTMVNELRFGRLAGENAFPRNQPFGTSYRLSLNHISNPYDSTGGSTGRDNIVYHLRDTVSWSRGRHQLKAGAEWRRRTVDAYSFFGVAPAYLFDDDDHPAGWSNADVGSIGGGDLHPSDGELARDLMNNVVGAVETIFQTFNVASLDSGFAPNIPERRVYRTWELDGFFQDSWAVRSNVVLGLGLRWEYASPATEVNGLVLLPEFSSVYGVSGEAGLFRPGLLAGEPCPMLDAPVANPNVGDAVSLIRGCASSYQPAGRGLGRPLWNADKNNFAPVISLAWDPSGDGKTAIRGGYRISYFQDAFSILDGNLDDNEGLTVSQGCLPIEGDCARNPGGLALLRDLGPAGTAPETPPFSLPGSRTILDSTAMDFRAIQPGLATPYYHEWSVGISREIADDWALEVRYVGTRGSKLRRMADFNEINVSARDDETGQTFLDAFLIAQSNLGCNGGGSFGDDTGLSCLTPNPLMAKLAAGEPDRIYRRAGLLDALRFSEPGQFAHRLTQVETSRVNGSGGRVRGGSFWGRVLNGSIPVNFFQANPFVASSRALINDGFSTYNALQVELRRRFSAGLQVQGNYTFGKALSDFDGDENTLLNDTRPSSLRNPRYTTGQFMPRHAAKLNYVYELPVGAGRRLNPRGAVGSIFGGWQMGGLLSFRTGRPLSIVSGRGAFHRQAISNQNTVDLATPVSNGDLRAMTRLTDINGGVYFVDPCMSAILGRSCSVPSTIEGLFEQPEAGALGELAQTPVYGPQRFLFDFNLMKRQRLGERTELEFRWEVFNLFNNVAFDLPGNSIYSPGFGRISATVSSPRLMQFAMKLNF